MVYGMHVEEPRRLASVEEAAAYAGRHHATIRRWIHDKHIAGYRKGLKLLYVDLDEIDALLALTRVEDAS